MNQRLYTKKRTVQAQAMVSAWREFGAVPAGAVSEGLVLDAVERGSDARAAIVEDANQRSGEGAAMWMFVEEQEPFLALKVLDGERV